MNPFIECTKKGDTNTFNPGDTKTWDLPRTSAIRSIVLCTTGIITNAPGSTGVAGLRDIIKSVTVDCSDSWEVLKNLSGFQLDFMHQMKTLSKPYHFNVGGVNAANMVVSPTTGRFRLNTRIVFENPKFGGVERYRTCIPAFMLSSAKVYVEYNSISNLDSDGDLNFSNLETTLYTEQFEDDPTGRLKTFAYLRPQQMCTSVNSEDISTGIKNYRLPVDFLYSTIGVIAYKDRYNLQDELADGPFNPSDKAFLQLIDLRDRVKDNGNFFKNRQKNIVDVVDDLIPGTFFWPFNSGTASLFDPNINMATTNNINVYATTVSGVDSRIEFLHERINDPQNVLGVK